MMITHLVRLQCQPVDLRACMSKSIGDVRNSSVAGPPVPSFGKRTMGVRFVLSHGLDAAFWASIHQQNVWTTFRTVTSPASWSSREGHMTKLEQNLTGRKRDSNTANIWRRTGFFVGEVPDWEYPWDSYVFFFRQKCSNILTGAGLDSLGNIGEWGSFCRHESWSSICLRFSFRYPDANPNCCLMFHKPSWPLYAPWPPLMVTRAGISSFASGCLDSLSW